MGFVLIDTGILRDASDTGGLNAAPNHTELNGYDHWEVEAGNGIFEIQTGGLIVALTAQNRGSARWKHPAVTTKIGQYVIADINSTAWTGNAVAGLEANSRWEVGDAIWAYIGTNSYDIEHRTGSNTLTFPISSGGISPGYPANSSTKTVCFGVHQMLDGQPPLLGLCVNDPAGSRQHVLVENGSAGAGIYQGLVDVYPAIFQWSNVAVVQWQFISVYRDFALTIRGLDPSWGVRFVDSNYGTGTTDIHVDANGEVRYTMPLGINPPIAYGTQVTIYTDPGTWLVPLAGGSATLGDMDPGITDGVFWPGCIIEWSTQTIDRIGMLVNWENDDDWTSHSADDVTASLTGVKIVQVAADPRIEVDTMLVTLKDPNGRYVPGRVESPLYGLVRLDREVRWNVERNGIKVCRFYGKVKEYAPILPHKTDVDRFQKCQIRVESPLRELTDSKLTLVTPPSGVLVAPDGSGVIAALLSLVPEIIPPETWRLIPTDVTPEAGFLTSGMSLQTALEQCAILADAVYYIDPHYRETLSPKFYFRWTPRTTSHAVVDHTWVETQDTVSFLAPRFTADEL